MYSFIDPSLILCIVPKGGQSANKLRKLQICKFVDFITIYAPMIYTDPCVMFLMRADTLRGQMRRGWDLEMESILGPVKWHRADRRVPFGAQKTRTGLLCLCRP
jgi:hypothetical protein